MRRGCEDNLIDLMHVINLAKGQEKRYRVKKVRVAMRQRTFLVFVDLKKAFDKVNR